MIVTPTQMHNYLEGSEFPMDKAHVLQTAGYNGAPEHILSMLEEVQDMRYDNLRELMDEIDIVEPEVAI
jgi:hypothetical protein